MRKRNRSPLGPSRPVRTIPIPIAPRGADAPAEARRPLLPLEPRLAALATELRPPTTGGSPAGWTSWAASDRETDLLIGHWETPVVDGEPAGGDGVGFAPPEVDLGPIALTAADPTTAGAAGWAPTDPAAADAAPVRSWVGTVAGLTPTDPTGATPLVLTAPAPRPVDGDAQARALHPSRSPHPHPSTAPATPDATPAPVGRVPVDPEDFTTRLRRGTAFATTEQQVLTLAERALARLSPDGRSRWLVAHPDESLTLRFAAGPASHAGCAVADTASCPALASGRVRRFERSDELDACPQLLAIGGPSCAVVCVPIPGPGPLRGVLQTSAPVEAPLDLVTAALLDRTAQALATRIAELRDAADAEPAGPAGDGA